MQDTKVRVLETAVTLFRRQGYNATGMKAISAASGAPLGSVYHFFPGGKAELAEAAIRQGGSIFLELINNHLSEHSDLRRALESFFDAAAQVLEVTDYEDACPIGTLALEVASSDDRLRKATADVFSVWINAVTSHLTRMGLAEERAARFAEFAFAALEGAFMLARARRDADIVRNVGAMVAGTTGNLPVRS